MLSMTNRIGDTEYQIFCTISMYIDSFHLNLIKLIWISYIDSGLKYNNNWKKYI